MRSDDFTAPSPWQRFLADLLEMAELQWQLAKISARHAAPRLVGAGLLGMFAAGLGIVGIGAIALSGVHWLHETRGWSFAAGYAAACGFLLSIAVVAIATAAILMRQAMASVAVTAGDFEESLMWLRKCCSDSETPRRAAGIGQQAVSYAESHLSRGRLDTAAASSNGTK